MNPENSQGGPVNSGQNAPKEVNSNTVMAVLSYLGPLVFIPYFTSKDNVFVRFHMKQGFVIFSIEVIVWLLSSVFYSMFYSFLMIINIINLITLVLSIIGIINAIQGKQKELPLVGGFSSHFNF